MPVAWQVQAAGTKPAVERSLQSSEFPNICLWGLLRFIFPSAPSFPRILNPIVLEGSEQNHLLSETFFSLQPQTSRTF